MHCTSDCEPTAAPVRAAILLPAGRSRVWQERVALALSGVADVQCRIVRVRAARYDEDAQWRRLAAEQPELQELRVDGESEAAEVDEDAWDAVIDLAGIGDAAPWRARSRQGVWQPLDTQGLHLAAPYAAHASIVSGRGGEVALVRDGAVVLDWMRYYADPHYPRALGHAYLRVVHLLAANLLELAHGDGELATEAFAPVAASLRWRRVLAGLRGRWRSQLRRLRSQWLSESWMIGVVDAPIERVLDSTFAQRIRWLGGRDAAHYRADPFGLPGDDRLLYCETYDYRDGVGRLELLRLDADGRVAQADPAGPQRPGHVSYPYVFEHSGRVYAIPETAQRRCCELYEIDAGGHWRFVSTLLDDVAVADASLFRWEGRFWLAYTDLSWGAFDNLCLSYADELRGPWRRHARHPVKLDHRSSRPAGTPFFHDGELYRPAQDCGSGYGEAVALNRVRLCTPHLYREEVVGQCRPDPCGRNPHGLHTVSAWGGSTLVDGKRYVFNLYELGRKLSRRCIAPVKAVGG